MRRMSAKLLSPVAGDSLPRGVGAAFNKTGWSYTSRGVCHKQRHLVGIDAESEAWGVSRVKGIYLKMLLFNIGIILDKNTEI